MKYIYSAKFIPIEDGSGFYARIPDLPGCITTGKNLSDAIDQISDAASIWLVTAEDEAFEIPSARPQDEIEAEKGAIFSLIQVDTIAYRSLIDTRSVRKNVSLPAWMSNLADKRGINCSKVLQDGLIREFESADV